MDDLAASDAIRPERDEPAIESSAPRGQGRGRLALAMVVMVILIGLAGLLLHWWTVGQFVQTTNDAFLQADQVTVASKLAGYVEAVLVRDNQDVRTDQPLVRIDVRDARARLDQANAQVAQGAAAIRQAEAQIALQDVQIVQAQAQLAAARASLAFASGEVDRYGPLVQVGAETRERLEQLRNNRDQAGAQTRVAAAQVLAGQRQIGTLRSQVQVAEAQSQQALAQARQARHAVDDAVIRASLDGRIGDRSVRAGQFVQPGTRLMTVVPLQSIYLVANFKETQLGRMRRGQPVEIKVDALAGQRLRGVIESFSPGTAAQFALLPANNATGNFTKIVQRVPVRIRVDAPANVRKRLLPGLSAEVSVDTRNLSASACDGDRCRDAGR